MSYYAQIVDNTMVKVLSTNQGTIAENIEAFTTEYAGDWFEAQFVATTENFVEPLSSWEKINNIVQLLKYYSWTNNEGQISAPSAHSNTGVYQWNELADSEGFWENL